MREITITVCTLVVTLKNVGMVKKCNLQVNDKNHLFNYWNFRFNIVSSWYDNRKHIDFIFSNFQKESFFEWKLNLKVKFKESKEMPKNVFVVVCPCFQGSLNNKQTLTDRRTPH